MVTSSFTMTVEVEISAAEALTHVSDRDLKDELSVRNILKGVSDVFLEDIIEPFLPDSIQRPAKWLAMDIANAIRSYKRVAA